MKQRYSLLELKKWKLDAVPHLSTPTKNSEKYVPEIFEVARMALFVCFSELYKNHNTKTRFDTAGKGLKLIFPCGYPNKVNFWAELSILLPNIFTRY